MTLFYQASQRGEARHRLDRITDVMHAFAGGDEAGQLMEGLKKAAK